jgi:hypothetical protein
MRPGLSLVSKESNHVKDDTVDTQSKKQTGLVTSYAYESRWGRVIEQ